MSNAVLIGYGAIGKWAREKLANHPELRITHILEQAGSVEALERELGGAVKIVSQVDQLPPDIACGLECAGHAAVEAHVPKLLARGISIALSSVGALVQSDLATRLEVAAQKGGATLRIVSGAIGGLDAIAAARLGGLEGVVYVGRKPPLSWRGTPAERLVDLGALDAPTIIFQGSAGEAATLYPKNANVAAALSLAGIGLDRTRVTLVADPQVTTNVHEVTAFGDFGRMTLQMSGRPLAQNPKTSALAAFSAVRALLDIARFSSSLPPI